ncbi:hypothetical protein FQZ97_898120 [compost metagenome]
MVVDTDHHDIRPERAQRNINVWVVRQVDGLLPAPNICQLQLHVGAVCDVLERALVALARVAKTDDQDLHVWASWRSNKRSPLPTKPKDS